MKGNTPTSSAKAWKAAIRAAAARYSSPVSSHRSNRRAKRGSWLMAATLSSTVTTPASSELPVRLIDQYCRGRGVRPSMSGADGSQHGVATVHAQDLAGDPTRLLAG